MTSVTSQLPLSPAVAADIARRWPHASRQNEQADAMLTRLAGWRELVHGVGSYLDDVAALEAYYGKMHSSLAERLTTGSDTYGALKDSLEALREYSRQVANKHLTLGSNITSQCTKLMGQLRKIIDEDVRGITNEIKRHQENLRLCRIETLVALNMFEKAAWAASSTTADMPGGDPWLLQETLNLKCEKLFSQERVFNESMLGFYGELAKIDAYLMENIQIVLKNFSDWKAAMSNADITAAHAEIGKFCALIKPGKSFEKFAEESGLNDKQAWLEAVKPLEYQYKDEKCTKTFKSGFLQRRVGTLNVSWKTSRVVLTESGFLHCFDGNSATIDFANPLFTINLKKAQLDAPQQPAPIQFSFEIVMPSTSSVSAVLGSPRLALMASSYREMLDWVTSIRVKSDQTRAEVFNAPNTIEEVTTFESELGGNGVHGDDDFVVITVQQSTAPIRAESSALPPPEPENVKSNGLGKQHKQASSSFLDYNAGDEDGSKHDMDAGSRSSSALTGTSGSATVPTSSADTSPTQLESELAVEPPSSSSSSMRQEGSWLGSSMAKTNGSKLVSPISFSSTTARTNGVAAAARTSSFDDVDFGQEFTNLAVADPIPIQQQAQHAQQQPRQQWSYEDVPFFSSAPFMTAAGPYGGAGTEATDSDSDV